MTLMERTDLEFVKAYQWNYRPQTPRRPEWFTEWPGGNRIAVTFNIMHEWESRPTPHHTVPNRPLPPDTYYREDFFALTLREYGANFGFYRLLDVFDTFGIKVTVLSSGLTATLFPDSVREAVQRGHEVGSHSWDQTIHPTVYKTKEEEREALVKSIEAIQAASGQRPLGYMSQGPRPGPFTLELSAELGFKWNGDYDTDVPYTMDVNGKKVVSLGYVRPSISDNEVWAYGFKDGLEQLKYEFLATWEEAQRHPMKFRYTMHNYVGGRPGMARLLREFIQYVRGFPGVWFARCDEIADFWLAHEGA
jgi:peptidoglycan/xylan/chitin deacetylase (PgdA/CDA1 family)